jgi:hypothetical protein
MFSISAVFRSITHFKAATTSVTKTTRGVICKTMGYKLRRLSLLEANWFQIAPNPPHITITIA